MLQVDSALRSPRGAGSEEPDGRVVAVRVGGRQLVRLRARGFGERLERPALTAYDQNVLQVSRALRRTREVLKQRFVYDGDARARVFKVVAVVVRRQKRVDHRDDAARAAVESVTNVELALQPRRIESR